MSADVVQVRSYVRRGGVQNVNLDPVRLGLGQFACGHYIFVLHPRRVVKFVSSLKGCFSLNVGTVPYKHQKG